MLDRYYNCCTTLAADMKSSKKQHLKDQWILRDQLLHPNLHRARSDGACYGHGGQSRICNGQTS